MINAITLPRPMVNALLHQAQLAGDKAALGIISQKQGGISHHYPIEANSNAENIKRILSKIKSNNENVYAIYRSHDSVEHKALNDALNEKDILQLVISLDIKGVLQISGYTKNKHLQEIQLTLR